MLHCRILVFVILFINVPAFSQPPADHQNAFGLSWGPQDYRSQDLILSPLIYRGNSLLMGELFYERRTKNGLHRVGFALSQIDVRASDQFSYFISGEPHETSNSEALTIRLHYLFGKNIFRKDKTEILVGGFLEGDFNYLEYHFGPVKNNGTVVAYSLSAWTRGTLKLSPTQSLNIETGFPLVAWVARSTFAISDEERLKAFSDFIHVTKNGELAVFTDFLDIHARIFYRRFLSSVTQLLLAYQFEYLKSTNFLKAAILRNSFEIGFVYNF
ncbi:MAG: hypothetical protein ACE5HS_15140 [bacterium]